MTELIVVGFEGTARARQVLDQMQLLNKLDLVDLEDAVAVYREQDGTLRVDETLFPTATEQSTLGGVLGALVGFALAAPFMAAAIPGAAVALGLGSGTLGAVGGAVVGHEDATSYRDEYGLSDQFVKSVSGMVQPGNSAAFLLVRAKDPAVVAEQFRGYGGTVLRTTLPADKVAKLEKLMGDRRTGRKL